MPNLLDTVIDDDVRQSLESGGFFTEGFEGDTLGGYRDWYKGAFGVDPFATAVSLNTGGPVPTSVDSVTDFLGRNPLNFDPDVGFTGNAENLSNQQLGQLQLTEERRGDRQEQDARQRGLGMINWLMGISSELSGTQFGRIAPVALAGAQANLNFDAPVQDFSGILGIRNQEAMRREREQARKFDFTRDLLPQLIGLGSLGRAGGGRGGRQTSTGSQGGFNPLTDTAGIF